MRAILFILAGASLASTTTAQMAAPPGWKWVTDGPAKAVETEDAAKTADGLWFVQMPPGFHITMGPGGNLFHSATLAEGRFELESEFFLFPDASGGEYGLLLGGRGGEGRLDEWVGFVARRDGSAAILRRHGGATEPARAWQASSAIVPGRSDGTARNVLRVIVGADVRFQVNGAEVARIARDSVAVDGLIGFRVGRGVNLHATSFDLTRRLAPVPPPRNP